MVNITVLQQRVGEIDIEGGFSDLGEAIEQYLTAPFEDDADTLLREPILFRDGDGVVLAVGTYTKQNDDMLLRLILVETGMVTTHRCTAEYSAVLV